MHGSKGKQVILFTTSHQQAMTSHFLASKALVLQKTNAAFSAEQVPYGMEYPFAQVGSSVLAVLLPKLLPTPQLTVLWSGDSLERQPWYCASTDQQ